MSQEISKFLPKNGLGCEQNFSLSRYFLFTLQATYETFRQICFSDYGHKENQKDEKLWQTYCSSSSNSQTMHKRVQRKNSLHSAVFFS